MGSSEKREYDLLLQMSDDQNERTGTRRKVAEKHPHTEIFL